MFKKYSFLTAFALIGMAASASASLILNVNDLTPSGTGGATAIATPDSGTFASSISGGPSSYAITVSNLTVDGVGGYTLTYDLSLASSTGVLGFSAGSPAGWGVSGGGQFKASESLTFSISSLSLAAPVGFTGSVDSFQFTGATFYNLQGNATPTLTATPGSPGVAANSSGNDSNGKRFNVTALDTTFTLSGAPAVPELTSVPVLAGLLFGSILMRRRRR